MKKALIIFFVVLFVVAIIIILSLWLSTNKTALNDIIRIVPFAKNYYVGKKIIPANGEKFEVYQNENRQTPNSDVKLLFIGSEIPTFTEKIITDAHKEGMNIFVSVDNISNTGTYRTYLKLNRDTNFS